MENIMVCQRDQLEINKPRICAGSHSQVELEVAWRAEGFGFNNVGKN